MFDRVHLQILRVYHLSIGLQSQCYAWPIPVGAWSTLPQPGQSSRKNCPKEDKNNSEYQLKHLKYVDSDMKKMISMNKNPLTMFVFNGKLHETIITKFFQKLWGFMRLALHPWMVLIKHGNWTSPMEVSICFFMGNHLYIATFMYE